MSSAQWVSQKGSFDNCTTKGLRKKLILLNIENLFVIFSPRLSGKFFFIFNLTQSFLVVPLKLISKAAELPQRPKFDVF